MDYGCSTVLEPRGVAHTPRRHDGVSSATVRRDSTHEVAPGLNGSTPVAVRYAWSNEVDSCCESLAPTQACQPEACPIYNKNSMLPGNPFSARIEGGKCVCIPLKCAATKIVNYYTEYC